MIGKRRLTILIVMLSTLTTFSLFYLSVMRVSAVDQPAIYIVPAWGHTIDPASEIGTNYTISVYTNYSGSDVWGYEFTLNFNSSVLEGVEVVNGDLITADDGIIMWFTAGFNNTEGLLDLTGNSFFDPPGEPTVVSGPGILANVTFTIVGYGVSEIALGEGTRLMGGLSVYPWTYNIIEPPPPYNHLDNGIFFATIPGDIDRDGDVDRYDFSDFAGCYGSDSADPNYILDADCDGDGDVDRYDFSDFAGNYGKTYP